MSEFGNGYKWSQAAVKGLLLALITIVCNTITYFFPGNAIVSLLAFLVRTTASIWLLVSVEVYVFVSMPYVLVPVVVPLDVPEVLLPEEAVTYPL